MAKKEVFIAPQLYNFIDVLELLEKTPKTNDKKAILEKNKNLQYLKEYLVLAIDDRVKFNINKIEENKGTGTSFNRMGRDVWGNFERVVDALVNQTISGHAANDAVESFLRTCNTDLERKWYKRCIQKDIASTKVGRKIMDDVWPGSVLYWKCGLADQEDKIDKVVEEDTGKFIWGYAYVEMKKNGVRTFFEEYENCLLTPVGRSGLPIDNFEIIRPFLAKLGIHEMIWDGECSVNDCLEDTMTVFGFDFSKTKEDFTGKSGKVRQKAWEKYQAEYDRADALRKQLKFTIFACVPRDEWYAHGAKWTYEQMRIYLEVFVKPLIEKYGLQDKIEVIDRYRVETYHEARDIANAWIYDGFEGAIVKNPKGTYQFRRCTDWIKIKEEDSASAFILEVIKQKETYQTDGTIDPPMMGKFKVQDANGRVYNVGTSTLLSREKREEIWNNKESWINKVIDITCQRFSNDAAICPRIVAFRDDMTRNDVLNRE